MNTYRLFSKADLDRCIEQLRALHARLGKCVVEIRPYKKPRSPGLNAYAWGYVVTPIAEFVGESPECQWEIMCGEYFGWVAKEFRGHKYPKPRRTTTTNEKGERDVLSWEQMTSFVHFCESVAAELGVPVDKSGREAA